MCVHIEWMGKKEMNEHIAWRRSIFLRGGARTNPHVYRPSSSRSMGQSSGPSAGRDEDDRCSAPPAAIHTSWSSELSYRVLGGRRPRSCAEASAPGGPYTLAMPNTFSPASCQLLPQRPSPHTAVEVERLYEGLYGVHPTLMGHAAAV